jgi:hypothetical protein
VIFPSYRPPYFVSTKVLKAEALGADAEVLSKVAASANPISGRLSYEGVIDFNAEGSVAPLQPTSMQRAMQHAMRRHYAESQRMNTRHLLSTDGSTHAVADCR